MATAPANPPAAAPQDKQPETMPLPKPGEVLPNNDPGQDNTQPQQKPDAELPEGYGVLQKPYASAYLCKTVRAAIAAS